MNDQATRGEIDACVVFEKIRTISRVVTRHFDDAMRPYGITASQFVLLRDLKVETKAVHLARTHNIEKSTLSRNLGRLETLGLIERGINKRREGQPLRITEDGLEVLRAAETSWEEASDDLVIELGIGEQVVRMINTLCAQIELHLC